jgi:hypothetical protein
MCNKYYYYHHGLMISVNPKSLNIASFNSKKVRSDSSEYDDFIKKSGSASVSGSDQIRIGRVIHITAKESN